MKKIFKIFCRWRYRRLYSRLFRIYANKCDYADHAGEQAAIAFQWHTGKKWVGLFNNPDA